MRKWRTSFALLAAFSLVAAACGDDDEDPVAESSTSDGGSTATTVDDAEPECGLVSDAPTPEAPAAGEAGADLSVGLVYDVGGRGDKSFNDSAAAGFDRATTEFGFTPVELEPEAGGENREELLRTLAEDGTNLVFAVGFAFADSVTAASTDYPDTTFGLIDSVVEADNVASLVFAEEQGSFLVGAAAASKSTTGKIGFIGGVEIDLIKKFEAGYVAGAKQVNPDIEIEISYITPAGDFSGFNDPAKGKEIAKGMYDGGADVVYHAAGGSGSGLFEAAAETGQQCEIWAIGVDSDQILTAPADQQPYILTSMLKRVDVAVYETAQASVDGTLAGGITAFDLSVDGVGYSTNNTGLDAATQATLEDLKQQIIDGEIEVPTAP